MPKPDRTDPRFRTPTNEPAPARPLETLAEESDQDMPARDRFPVDPLCPANEPGAEDVVDALRALKALLFEPNCAEVMEDGVFIPAEALRKSEASMLVFPGDVAEDGGMRIRIARYTRQGE